VGGSCSWVLGVPCLGMHGGHTAQLVGLAPLAAKPPCFTSRRLPPFNEEGCSHDELAVEGGAGPHGCGPWVRCRRRDARRRATAASAASSSRLRGVALPVNVPGGQERRIREPDHSLTSSRWARKAGTAWRRASPFPGRAVTRMSIASRVLCPEARSASGRLGAAGLRWPLRRHLRYLWFRRRNLDPYKTWDPAIRTTDLNLGSMRSRPIHHDTYT
jgi:hypothetical protein